MTTPQPTTDGQHSQHNERTQERTVFPVTSSVLSADALLHELAADYSLDTLQQCQLLKRGLNDTYLVRTVHDSYILRIYRTRWRTRSEILFEMEMLSFLAQHGAPVSRPVERKDGTFIRELQAPEGERFMALFTYAQGEEPTLTEEHSSQMGCATAHLHHASAGFTSRFTRFSLDLEHLIFFPLERASPYLEHRPDDLAFLFRLADALHKHLTALAPRLDWGICHGDATERNVHITADGLVTFFDFDCAGWGWRAYDLATFRMSARKREHGGALWAAYLKGYTSQRPIHPVDMEAEPLLFVARIFWSMGIFPATAADDVAEPLNDAYLDRQLRFLRPWAAQHLAQA